MPVESGSITARSLAYSYEGTSIWSVDITKCWENEGHESPLGSTTLVVEHLAKELIN